MKIAAFFALILAFAFPATAQKFQADTTEKSFFYIGIRAGYQLPALKHYMPYNSPYSAGATQVTASSLGKGMLFGLNAGFRMNSMISIELEASYLPGDRFSAELDPRFIPGNEIYEPLMLRLSPALKFHAGKKKFRSFLLLGPTVGIYTRLKHTLEYEVSSANYEKMVSDVKGGIPIGCRAEAGVDWSLGERWQLTLCLNGIFQNWTPQASTLVEWTANGVDQLPNATVHQKEITYVDNPKLTGSGEPAQAFKPYFPFSSWGLVIGISYSLTQ